MKKLLFYCLISTGIAYAQTSITEITKDYKEIKRFDGQRAVVRYNNKYGVINAKGEEIVPCIYDEVSPFYKGYAEVTLNEKKGFIDSTGSVIGAIKYDELGYFFEGLGRVSIDGKWGFINTLGQEQVPLIYTKVWKFSNGRSFVEDYDNAYIIDKQGKVIVSGKQYQNQSNEFHNGLVVVNNSDYYSNNYHRYIRVIDTTGKEIVPPLYAYISDFSKGRAIVQKDKKYGILNLKGELIIPLIYDDLQEAGEGLIKAKRNNYYGFIDTVGNMVVDIQYDELDIFRNRVAIFKKNNQTGLITCTGREIISTNYKAIIGFVTDLVIVQDDSSNIGVIDTTGRIIIPVIYRYMSDIVDAEALYFSDEILVLSNANSKMGVIDKTGKIIVPFIYDIIAPVGGFLVTMIDMEFSILDAHANMVMDGISLEDVFTEHGIVIRKKGKTYLLTNRLN